jgi:hypothetical protein
MAFDFGTVGCVPLAQRPTDAPHRNAKVVAERGDFAECAERAEHSGDYFR